MRINNNLNAYKHQTFKSQANIKKICLETLDEFRKEFKGVKSPTKIFAQSDTAKCPGKKKLYEEFGIIWDLKIKEMRAEYKKFKQIYPTYTKKMNKLNELIKTHKVIGCEEASDYYQYMLAQKGVYSEATIIRAYSSSPPYKINHMHLEIKETPEDIKTLNADAWLETVEENNTFFEKLYKFMGINHKTHIIEDEKLLQINGYDEFFSKINPPKQP